MDISNSDNLTDRSLTQFYISWYYETGSTGYILQVDTSAAFNSPLLSTQTKLSDDITRGNGYTLSSPYLTGLLYGTTYYYRACAYNNVDTSHWSAVQRFTTVHNSAWSAPTQLSPADDSTGVVHLSAVLVWQSTTADVQLGVPQLVAPADGSSQQGNLVLEWQPVFGALAYDVQVALGSDFTGAVSSYSTTATSLPLAGLPVGIAYSWRVRSTNGNASSDWSDTWHFTTTTCTPVSHTLRDTVCEGTPYDFFGTASTAAGEYSHTLVAASGCDSTVVLQLAVHPRGLDGSEEATACDSYEWRGLTLLQSGNYPYMTTTVHGCDSMVTLHLTLHASATTDLYETAGNHFEWNGNEYAASGDYTQHFFTAEGCDSTVTLHLTLGLDSPGATPFGLAPNPASGQVELTLPQAGKVTLFDAAGRMALALDLAAGCHTLDLARLPRGLYLLRYASSGDVATHRLLIE